MTINPLARCQASLAIARDGALDTVLRLTARLAEQQAELARLRAAAAELARLDAAAAAPAPAQRGAEWLEQVEMVL